MLRRLLGDTAFWSGVQSYVQSHLQQTVETDDFRKHLERVSGRNLTRFFDQWFYGRGFPKLRGKHGPPSHGRTVAGGRPQRPTDGRRRGAVAGPTDTPGEFKFSADRAEASITLEQTQSSDHTLFTVDVDVLITYSMPAGPRASVLLTVPLGSRGVRKETAVARLPPGAKPLMVQVDPDHKVLLTLEMNPGSCGPHRRGCHVRAHSRACLTPGVVQQDLLVCS